METALLPRIASAIRRAYVNPAMPDFGFMARPAGETVAQQALLDAFKGAGFAVSDTTDVNEDVATHLVLARGGHETWLALSLAGPFAFVQATSDHAAEEEVVQMLASHGWALVPAELLREPSELRLEGQPATIGQALFAALPA